MVLEEEMKSLVEFLPHVAKGTAGAHIVGSTRHRKTDQSRPVGRQTVENRVFVRKVLHGGEGVGSPTFRLALTPKMLDVLCAQLVQLVKIKSARPHGTAVRPLEESGSELRVLC